jgi:hypothetical protein
LTEGVSPEFRRNIVNRLWALMMKRGLVHPLDLQHRDNPPSHSELLDLLAGAFAAMKYDVKAFVRELTLSRTYQRASEPAPGMGAADCEPARFAVAPLAPLSPEQLGWSVMQAVGLAASARAEAERALDASDPKFRDILSADVRRRALRAQLVEEAVSDRLSGHLPPFVAQFGGAAGQPQDGGEATVHQALFLSNGQPIQGWLQPTAGSLVERLSKLNDPAAVAEELYLSLLTRRPTSDEKDEVARHLDHRRGERVPALQDLAWSLLASTEFRFQH